MRITQNHITRQYTRNSQSALSNWTNFNDKILTRKQFKVASEAPVSAARSMNLRTELSNVERQLTNLEIADDLFTTAESTLLGLSDDTDRATSLLIQAATSTVDSATGEEFEIISTELFGIAENMITQLNTRFKDKNLFSGSGNELLPFAFNGSEVTYNGMSVNNEIKEDFPFSKPVYVDVGIGMRFDDEGNVDSRTVMDLAMNGIELTGYGVDDEGNSKNLIALVYEAAQAVKNGNIEEMRPFIDKVAAAKSTLLIGVTDLGNKQHSVSVSIEKLTTDNLNLMQSYIHEASYDEVGLAEQITLAKNAESTYNASLAMGARIIPPSIFDYIK